MLFGNIWLNDRPSGGIIILLLTFGVIIWLNDNRTFHLKDNFIFSQNITNSAIGQILPRTVLFMSFPDDDAFTSGSVNIAWKGPDLFNHIALIRHVYILVNSYLLQITGK
jgi:hypothetical protein